MLGCNRGYLDGSFFSSKPLSEEGEISLENFVVCRVQVMEIKMIQDMGVRRKSERRNGCRRRWMRWVK